MSHLPPAHHKTSKRDSLNETKIKEKQNETVQDLNSNLAKSMTHHNQTKELTTWFLKKKNDYDTNYHHYSFSMPLREPRAAKGETYDTCEFEVERAWAQRVSI
jgi:hypothetical protein